MTCSITTPNEIHKQKPNQKQNQKQNITDTFRVGDYVKDKKSIDRDYGIISSVNRKSKQSKVDWYRRGIKESGSDYPHYRLLRIVNCQTLGDEPLYSMFDRTYNENGNNINNNPNNLDTSNNNNNNTNSNSKENRFELIINRGVINTLQSQLSELYNNTWQYIMKTQFKSKVSINNPSINDITINTCYQMYEKNDIKKSFNQLYDNTTTFETKINERVLSIARQIKEKTIKIPSSLGTQYLTLPLLNINGMNSDELFNIVYGIDTFCPNIFDTTHKYKYNPTVSAAMQPLFQFLATVMLIPAKNVNNVSTNAGDVATTSTAATSKDEAASTVTVDSSGAIVLSNQESGSDDGWEPDIVDPTFIGVFCFVLFLMFGFTFVLIIFFCLLLLLLVFWPTHLFCFFFFFDSPGFTV